MKRAGAAMADVLDEIAAARTAGVGEKQLAPTLALQRSAQGRLDFVNAENSMGFHAPPEGARIPGESIDLFRRGQVAAQGARLSHRGLSSSPPSAPPVP